MCRPGDSPADLGRPGSCRDSDEAWSISLRGNIHLSPGARGGNQNKGRPGDNGAAVPVHDCDGLRDAWWRGLPHEFAKLSRVGDDVLELHRENLRFAFERSQSSRVVLAHAVLPAKEQPHLALSCAVSGLTRMSKRLWSGVAVVYAARLPRLRTSVVGSPCEKPPAVVKRAVSITGNGNVTLV